MKAECTCSEWKETIKKFNPALVMLFSHCPFCGKELKKPSAQPVPIGEVWRGTAGPGV